MQLGGFERGGSRVECLVTALASRLVDWLRETPAVVVSFTSVEPVIVMNPLVTGGAGMSGPPAPFSMATEGTNGDVEAVE